MIKVALISAFISLTPTAKKIVKLNPVLDEHYVNQLSTLVDVYSDFYKINKDIILSILFQESSFNPFPRGCNISRERCIVDIGIGQINYKVWKNHFKLNRISLVRNFSYNLEVAFKILVDLKHRYGKIDKEWYCGYHSLTKHRKRTYCAKINSHLRRLSK